MKRDRIIVKCQQCGKSFETRPYLISVRKRGKYCSPGCYYKSKLGKRRNIIKLECVICGKEFYRNQCIIDRDRTKSGRYFCGKECVGKHNQILMRGDKNWNWKGGIAKRSLNDKKYKEWRLKVFTRDKFTCQICMGRVKYIQAHHIKSWAKYPKQRYVVKNGITLCIDCHLRNGLHCK